MTEYSKPQQPDINSDLQIKLFDFGHRHVNQYLKKEDVSSYEGCLYHYTTPVGLKGILETQKIWGTESSYLNDAQEIKYGVGFVTNYLSEIRTRESGLTAQLAGLAMEKLCADVDTEIYLACFCERGDLLSQWKGYTNFGGGYSIGFKASDLFRTKRKSPFYGISIRRVVYDKKTQAEMIDSEIKAVCEIACNLISEYSEYSNYIIEHASRHLAHDLTVLLMQFKANAFQEEQEWRAIWDNNGGSSREEPLPVEFRVSGKDIVPYVELDIAPSAQKQVWFLPIEEIIVGPRIDLNKARKSIGLIYRYLSTDMPLVNGSSVPLQS